MVTATLLVVSMTPAAPTSCDKMPTRLTCYVQHSEHMQHQLIVLFEAGINCGLFRIPAKIVLLQMHSTACPLAARCPHPISVARALEITLQILFALWGSSARNEASQKGSMAFFNPNITRAVLESLRRVLSKIVRY